MIQHVFLQSASEISGKEMSCEIAGKFKSEMLNALVQVQQEAVTKMTLDIQEIYWWWEQEKTVDAVLTLVEGETDGRGRKCLRLQHISKKVWSVRMGVFEPKLQ